MSMNDEFQKAAQSLTDCERQVALENLLDDASETETGIIRQILGDENKPLSEKQKFVYTNNIEPGLVEKCGNSACKEFVPAGTDCCASCEIKYG